MKVVEHFADGHSVFGTTLVFSCEPNETTGKVYHVDFEIHERISDTDLFEIFGYQGSGDWTEKLEEACPEVYGTVKWDGCSHVYFGNREKPESQPNGYLHLCGKRMWLWFSASMSKVFERSREILVEAGTWDKQQDKGP